MKTRYYVFLSIILAVIPAVAVFFTTSLLPHTHDGLVHLARMGAYYKAIHDGQFPVRWASDLNYGYGMPLFNFIYQIPYLISSIFIYLGFGLVNSFKITLSISYILSAVFSFLFAKEFFKDNKKAFLFSIFYQFFPFRLVEVFVRGSFGEVYTYAFLPLVLYGIIRIFNRGKVKDYVLTSISTALLILSHNSVSLLFFIILVSFILFFGRNKKNIIVASTALLVGLLLSAFYWVPAIAEHRYTLGDLYMRSIYQNHFVPFQKFFIPNFTNARSAQLEGISVWLGLTQTLVIFLGIYLLIKKKDKERRKFLLYAFSVLIASFFFMEPLSKIFWEKISLLRQFQFPWRFLAVSGFATTLLSVPTVFAFKNRYFYWIIIALTVGSTILYWRPTLGLDHVQESSYWNFPLNTTYYGETDVMWTSGPAKNYPKSPVEFVAGTGKITEYKKRSTIHTFRAELQTDSTIVDNTVYFPGWKVYVDNISVPVEFQDINWRGLITFKAQKGQHAIKVVFEESPVRKIADYVSLLAFISLVGYYLFLRNTFIWSKK